MIPQECRGWAGASEGEVATAVSVSPVWLLAQQNLAGSPSRITIFAGKQSQAFPIRSNGEYGRGDFPSGPFGTAQPACRSARFMLRVQLVSMVEWRSGILKEGLPDGSMIQRGPASRAQTGAGMAAESDPDGAGAGIISAMSVLRGFDQPKNTGRSLVSCDLEATEGSSDRP
jgi:hypothetical protein